MSMQGGEIPMMTIAQPIGVITMGIVAGLDVLKRTTTLEMEKRWDPVAFALSVPYPRHLPSEYYTKSGY